MWRYLQDKNCNNFPFHSVYNPVLRTQSGCTLSFSIPFQLFVMKSPKLSQFFRAMSEYDIFPEFILLNDICRKSATDLRYFTMLLYALYY